MFGFGEEDWTTPISADLMYGLAKMELPNLQPYPYR
jgi:hypothetical protein